MNYWYRNSMFLRMNITCKNTHDNESVHVVMMIIWDNIRELHCTLTHYTGCVCVYRNKITSVCGVLCSSGTASIRTLRGMQC